MHPLDNVIWHALTTRQTEFAESFDQARRFMQEVTLLAGIFEPNHQGYDSLAGLIGNSTSALFLKTPYQERAGWTMVAGAPLLQMVCENGGTDLSGKDYSAKRDAHCEVIELGPRDVPEMVELATLTKPGPFGTRTHEMGTYLGIRHDGKLVAMAGERLKVPGYTEVSAVCTHPDHTGHGYARILMTAVMEGIRNRGEIPFLHVREDNARAIELYQRLGFQQRVLSHFAVLRRTIS